MTPNNTVSLFPMDVSQLAKGQVLSIAELERILPVSHAHPFWGFALLNLQAQIAKRRRDLGLPLLTMRVYHNELIICDDADAAKTNRLRSKRRLKGYRKDAARNIAVDVSRLSDEDKTIHERTLRIQAMTLRGIRSARSEGRRLTAENQGRVTPKMIAGTVNDVT